MRVAEGVDITRTNVEFLQEQFNRIALHVLRCTGGGTGGGGCGAAVGLEQWPGSLGSCGVLGCETTGWLWGFWGGGDGVYGAPWGGGGAV